MKWGLIILLGFLSAAQPATVVASSKLNALNHNLKTKKPKIETKQRYKLAIKKEKDEKKVLADAVIWHPAPYKKLATKLPLSIETKREQTALAILIEEAEQHNPDYKEAKEKLSHSKILGYLKNIINNYSKFNLEHNDSREAVLFQQITQEIQNNFQIYKQNYFKNSRAKQFQEKIENSKLKLQILCGATAINKIDKLYQEEDFAII